MLFRLVMHRAWGLCRQTWKVSVVVDVELMHQLRIVQPVQRAAVNRPASGRGELKRLAAEQQHIVALEAERRII